jgi:hypothetical protein
VNAETLESILHVQAQGDPQMSGKTGSKPTGHKPLTVRRRSAKTDGAFGKEGVEQIDGEEGRTPNLDKAVEKRITEHGIDEA